MRRMFSKNQIKDLIKESPAEIKEALKGQDIVVKTLEQSEANWNSGIITLTPSTAITSAGLEYTNIYNKVEVINGIMYFVNINKITNPTESSVSLNYQFYGSANITLPSDIASKIVDYNGIPASENGNMAKIHVGQNDGASVVDASYYGATTTLMNGAANVIQFTNFPASHSLGAGKSAIIETRFFLTIL